MKHIFLIGLLLFISSSANSNEQAYTKELDGSQKIQREIGIIPLKIEKLEADKQYYREGLLDLNGENERQRKLAHARETLHAVWLYDEDEEARKRIDEDARYNMYGCKALRVDSGLFMYGKDYAAVAAPDYAELPLELCEKTIAAMPEEKRKVYQESYDKLYTSGNDTKNDWYALYGRMVRDTILAEHAAASAERTEDWEKNKHKYSDLTTYLIEAKHERERKVHEETLALQKKLENERIEHIKHKKEIRIRNAIIISSVSILSILIICTSFRFIKHHAAKLKTLHPFTIAAVALLLVALFEMPHAYYTFLRVAICAYSIYSIATFWRRDSRNLRPLLAAAFAILYNPAFPIDLHYRDYWLIANIATAILTIAFLRIPIRKK